MKNWKTYEFPPAPLKSDEILTVNWDIEKHRNWLERFIDWFNRVFRGIKTDRVVFKRIIKVNDAKSNGGEK